MSDIRSTKAEKFRALHAGPAFVIANAWDPGSARILAGLGFPALATSSGAAAGVLGRRDGRVSRDEALAQAEAIVAATDLPVSADLEKGYGDSPDAVADTIRRAAAIGLVGGSIEDATGDSRMPLFPLAEATARVAAAVASSRALGFGFVVTARAENHIRGNPDLADTISRLQAFEAAGADVLMAPGLPDLEAVRTVCAAVSKPVNFMAGIGGRSFSVAELAAAGVKRISLATSLYRAAMAGLIAAASQVAQTGRLEFTSGVLTTAELNAYFPA
jgi:2-methylisocitrate lyase-like PEP mutase family enzyme